MTQTVSRGGSAGSQSTANAALLIGWGSPVQGREQRAPQVLSEALSYAKQLQERGEIESFEAIMLEPHGPTNMTGFILLHGDKEKLAKVRTSEQLIRLENRAQMVTTGVQVTGGYEGTAFDQQMQAWSQEAREFATSSA